MNYVLLNWTSPWLWGPLCAVGYIAVASFTNRIVFHVPRWKCEVDRNVVSGLVAVFWPVGVPAALAFWMGQYTAMQIVEAATNQPAEPKGREEK